MICFSWILPSPNGVVEKRDGCQDLEGPHPQGQLPPKTIRKNKKDENSAHTGSDCFRCSTNWVGLAFTITNGPARWSWRLDNTSWDLAKSLPHCTLTSMSFRLHRPALWEHCAEILPSRWFEEKAPTAPAGESSVPNFTSTLPVARVDARPLKPACAKTKLVSRRWKRVKFMRRLLNQRQGIRKKKVRLQSTSWLFPKCSIYENEIL